MELSRPAETIRPPAIEVESLACWLSRWGLIVAEFGMVQLVVQLLLAAAGLLIVRTLPKQEYALFIVCNSMQTTCNLFADWGMSIGLRSIGGRVWDDRYRFGQLLNTALGLRWQFSLVSFTVCLPLAGWMLWRNGAEPLQLAVLCLAVAAGVIPLLGSSVWNVSPQLHGEYRRLQNMDAGNAALRFALIGILAIGRMNALLAVLVGVVGNWVQRFFLRRWAREHADHEAPPNMNDRRELISISVKWLPNVVFFCFQGQVTLLILSLFGNPVNIADVTALGRIAVLFTVFSAIFSNVFAPRFARCQEPATLRRLYALLVVGSIMVLLLLLLTVWLFPGPFLRLLGGKYEQLGGEFGWVAAAACVSQIGTVIWMLNSSKAWIRLQSFAYIPGLLVAQAIGAFFLDFRQFHNVLIFNLITAATPVPLYFLDSLLGFRSLANPRS